MCINQGHSENWKRINSGADSFMMPNIPQDVFFDAMDKTVTLNSQWVPPGTMRVLVLCLFCV
jgi:hypothetical protein